MAEVTIGKLGLEIALHEPARQPLRPICAESHNNCLWVDTELSQSKP